MRRFAPLAFMACLLVWLAVPAVANTVTVHVFNFNFSINPKGQTIVDPTINVGDTIHWVWDEGTHSTTSVSGSVETWDSTILGAGSTFDHTFTHAGVFVFYCKVHGADNGNGTASGMSGTVTVDGTTSQPGITGISPTSANSGGAAFTLTVNGTNYVSGATVDWNGAALTTTFVNSGQLTATVPASDIATGGTADITVVNPDGGTSNTVTFTIKGSSVTITSLSPSSATAGGAAFTLTVNGTGFVSGATVKWNGSARTTTFVSSTQMTASISAGDIATAGTVSVTVVNPDNSTSNAATFTINNPTPVLSKISPMNANAGGPAFTLTVTGSGFVSNSTVKWNGTALTTTFVSVTKLTASVPAANIASAGKPKVTVVTPGPGGGTSVAKTFTILLTTLTLSSATLTKNSTTGEYTANVTLKNTGFQTAPSVTITSSTLGAAATNTALPVSVGSIAAGATATPALTYPSSAGTSGTKVTLKVSGKFTGGTFTGTLKVTLP